MDEMQEEIKRVEEKLKREGMTPTLCNHFWVVYEVQDCFADIFHALLAHRTKSVICVKCGQIKEL